jgi:hypothetical protein
MIRRQLPLVLVVFWIVALFSVRSAVGGRPPCRPAKSCPPPTAAPTATAVPTAVSGRPFPGPVTSRTLTVPSTITTASALNSWLAAQPDGSIIDFGPAYAMSTGLAVVGKSNLVLRGNGTTFTMSGPGDVADSSTFFVRNSNHISIEGTWTVVGNNPDTTNIFVPGKENSHVLALSGWYGLGPSSYVEITGVTASHIYGDFAYLEGQNVGSQPSSHDVWVYGNTGTWIGRNAVSYINVTDVLVEGNHFDKIGMDALDIEPNFAAEQARRATFRQNTIGAYGYMAQFQGWFVNTWSPQTSPVSDITVDDNDVAGNPAGRYDGSPRALHANIDHSQLSGIVFTNNRTALAAAGPVLVCGSGYHATQSGNVQPLTSGSFTNCTP